MSESVQGSFLEQGNDMEKLSLSHIVDQGVRRVISADLKRRPEQITKVLLGCSSVVRVLVIARIRRRQWVYALLVFLLGCAALIEAFLLLITPAQETTHAVALIVLLCITVTLFGLAGSSWWRYFKASVFLRRNNW